MFTSSLFLLFFLYLFLSLFLSFCFLLCSCVVLYFVISFFRFFFSFCLCFFLSFFISVSLSLASLKQLIFLMPIYLFLMLILFLFDAYLIFFDAYPLGNVVSTRQLRQSRRGLRVGLGNFWIRKPRPGMCRKLRDVAFSREPKESHRTDPLANDYRAHPSPITLSIPCSLQQHSACYCFLMLFGSTSTASTACLDALGCSITILWRCVEALSQRAPTVCAQLGEGPTGSSGQFLHTLGNSLAC